MTRWMFAVVMVLVALAWPASAQEKPVPFTAGGTELVKKAPDQAPILTDLAKLQVQNLMQKIELAQLRAQQAQRDFEDARTEIGKLIQSLQVEGYTLDLSTLSYSKAPPKKDDPPKKEGGK